MLSNELERNIRRIRETMGESSDLVVRKLKLGWPRPSGTEAALVYLDGMADLDAIQTSLIPPLLDRRPEASVTSSSAMLGLIRETVLSSGNIREFKDLDEGLQTALSGSVLLLLNGQSAGLSVSIPGMKDRAVSETMTQTVVKGPQDAFTEMAGTNITLIRRRIKDTRLRVSKQTLGTVTQTSVNVIYLEGIADDGVVKEVFKRLGHVSSKGVFEGQYIEEFFKEKRYTAYPTVYNTERPDTVAANVLEGRVAIVVDGSPFVMIVPAVFLDFVQSAEDYYQPVYFSNLIRLLRLLALSIALFAPSVYIAVTTFHQDLLPTQLLLSLAAQREGVPFPAFIEALLMEVTFEILREAGIRMPRTIGQAVSIVGTIVIGQAAVEAGIVSAAMVIVVSITAISSFVIPSYTLATTIRIHRFALMALAASFGFFGLTAGMLVMVVTMCSLDSFGVPYAVPYAPFAKSRQKDAFLRFPYWMIRGKRN